MNEELKLIKKHYGEKMMQLCRTLFPTILEKENKLLNLLLNNFEPNHSLYEDLDVYGKTDEFKSFIYGMIEKKEEIIEVTKTPEELMNEAGYILYPCKSENDIQSFKKYYKTDEALCTFTTNRLERCHVFFAVKKDVDLIKREDFIMPERQDQYGTSVISIQFTKDPSNTLSIKNRYNHRVIHPDATFSNNLDNIIPGLTESFAKHYSLKQRSSSSFELPNYVRAKDGKYYRYNCEINNIYYCSNNIIIDNFAPRRLVKDKYVLIDYFILDLQNKKIKLYDNKIEESFHNDIGDITKIEIAKDLYKNIKLTNPLGETILKINQNNVMVELYSNSIKKISDNFLNINQSLKKINLINLSSIENGFLCNNESLQTLEAPDLKTVGACFLNWNVNLREIIVPKLENIGIDFMYYNKYLEKFEAPNLETVGSRFLYNNEKLNEINVPKLEVVGNDFLYNNESLQRLEAPNLKSVGTNFLHDNKELNELVVPNLEKIEDDFLYNNESLQKLELPNLETVGSNFIYCNENLNSFNAPKLEVVENSFLLNNNSLQKLELPNLETVGSRFLYKNEKLNEINVPKLKNVGDSFLGGNILLESINVPELLFAGKNFLVSNKKLKVLELPKLIDVEDGFLCHNNELEYLNAPELETIGSHFLTRNRMLKELKLPKLITAGDWFLSDNKIVNIDFSSGGIKYEETINIKNR